LYRIAFILITVLALALGLLVGTLNASSVALDLLWIQLEWPLGLVVLTACAAGLLLGLLMAWFLQHPAAQGAPQESRPPGDGFGATGPLQHIDD